VCMYVDRSSVTRAQDKKPRCPDLQTRRGSCHRVEPKYSTFARADAGGRQAARNAPRFRNTPMPTRECPLQSRTREGCLHISKEDIAAVHGALRHLGTLPLTYTSILVSRRIHDWHLSLVGYSRWYLSLVGIDTSVRQCTARDQCQAHRHIMTCGSAPCAPA